jgi:hypothetical protein
MEKKSPVVTEKMFNSVKDRIWKMAYICHTKMKKPTIITVDDLYQEGCEVLLRIVKEGKYSPTGKAALGTVLFRYLKWHYINMMNRSYKSHDPYTKCKLSHKDGTPIYKDTTSSKLVYEDYDAVSKVINQDVVDVIDSLKGLDNIELEYIQFFIDTPDGITEKEKRNPMLFRKAARNKLEITRDQEEQIRSKVLVRLG